MAETANSTETVFAHTPAEPTFPPFVNLSRAGEAAYRLIVRSRHATFGGLTMPGATGVIELGREEVVALFRELARELGVPISRRI